MGLRRFNIARSINEVIFFLILAACAAGIYSNTFDASFHFDDYVNIVYNRPVRMDEISWGSLFRSSFDPEHPSTRPVAYISFALNYYFGRFDVFGYHLVNIIIHIVTGIGVYLLIKVTLGINNYRGAWPYAPEVFSEEDKRNTVIAASAALIWLTSPVQTQAVTYIVQRMASMAAMFHVYSFLLYVKGRIRGGKRGISYILMSVVLFILAVGTKESSITLPFMLLLYEFCFFRRFGLTRAFYIPLFLSVLAVAFLLYFFISDLVMTAIGYAIKERVYTEARIIIHYISLLLIPIPSRMALIHDFSPSTGLFSPITTLSSLLLIFAAAAYAIMTLKRRTFISFFMLWFFVNILLESLAVRLDLIYEHRLYLPSIGFYAIAAYGLVSIINRMEGNVRRSALGLMVLLAALFSINTYVRNLAWHDEISLWSDNAMKAPDISRPHEGLGMAYLRAGELDKAESELERALRLDPLSPVGGIGLGIVYINKGDYDHAFKEFEYVAARRNLGVGLRYPGMERIFYDIGEEFLNMGRAWDAVQVFRIGLKVNPEDRDIIDALKKLEGSMRNG